jgi:hypothetical protein
VSRQALALLQGLALAEMGEAGAHVEPDARVRKESRALLYGFAEYHLDRRMKSLPMLVRTSP